MSLPGEPTPHRHHLRGAHGRMRRRLLLVFAVVFTAIVGLAALGSAVGAPKAKPLCRPYRPCGPTRAVQPLINQAVWRSHRWGFTLEYPSQALTVAQQDAGSVILQANLGNGSTGTILVQGSSIAPGGPAAAISRQIGGLSGVTQVGPDSNPTDQLLGAEVGYRPGMGRVYTGYFTAPQGVGQPVALVSEAATDGSFTVSVTVGGASNQTGPSSLLYALADQVINSVHWPSDRSDSTSGSGAP
jgi:hypothetical protein